MFFFPDMAKFGLLREIAKECGMTVLFLLRVQCLQLIGGGSLSKKFVLIVLFSFQVKELMIKNVQNKILLAITS